MVAGEQKSRKIYRNGNSPALNLSTNIVNYGFQTKDEVIYTPFPNKIVIELRQPKKLHKSHIKEIINRRDNKLVVFFKDDEEKVSTRFEEKWFRKYDNDRSSKRVSDICLLYYDYIEEKYLMIFIYRLIQKTLVHYISEEDYSDVKNGFHPTTIIKRLKD